mgnify:CR=1 FL=1
MNGYPWYPRYPNDYLGSRKVGAMNIAEEGVYNRLLDYEWNEPDCTLPADISVLKMLTKIMGSPLEPFVNFELVLKCFKPYGTQSGRMYNPRLRKEWLKMKQLRRKKSASGKKGMASRWG